MIDTKKKSLKVNAVLNGIKQSCSILFPLITFPYISRVLGSNGYGKYSFSFSITYYFILFAALGVNTYAIREGAKIRDHKDKITKFCSQIFSINVFSMLLSYLVMFVLIAINAKIRSYFYLILIQSTAMILQTIGTDWINSIYEDFFYITIRYIIIQFLALISMFVFVHHPNDLWKYCVIATLATNAGGLINIFYVRRYVKFHFTLNLDLNKHLIPLLILFINTIAISIYVNSDVTMLGFYRSDQYVGVYSFVSKIYNILKTLINAVIVVSVPRISYIVHNSHSKYKEYLNKIFSAVNIVLLPIMVGLACMSTPIIFIAGGAQYLSGSVALRILSVATIFAIYASLFSNCVLIVNREENKCLISTLLSAGVNVGLNFIFIPYFGMNGAAITTIIAEMINFFIQGYFARDYFKLSDLNIKLNFSCIVGSISIVIICCLCNIGIDNFITRFEIALLFSSVAYTIILVIMRNPIIVSVFDAFKDKLRLM